MRNGNTIAIAALLGAISLTPSANAGLATLDLIEDTREVRANASTSSSDGVFVSETAAAFGAPADLFADTGFVGPGDLAEAQAAQTSEFGPRSFHADLFATAIAGIAGQFSSAGATSTVDFTFSVDVETDYRLAIDSTMSGGFAELLVTMEAIAPSSGVLHFDTSSADHTGTLLPGTYRIFAFTQVNWAGDAFFGTSQANLDFWVPAPSTLALMPLGFAATIRRRR